MALAGGGREIRTASQKAQPHYRAWPTANYGINYYGPHQIAQQPEQAPEETMQQGPPVRAATKVAASDLPDK